MKRIYPDTVGDFYWNVVFPEIENEITNKPLEFITARGVANWNCSDFLKYWEKRYKEEFGFTPMVVNKFKTMNQLKVKVLDYFYERVNEEVKNYIDWVVQTCSATQAKVELLPYNINSYMIDKTGQKFKAAGGIDVTPKENIQSSAKSALEFFGSGYQDGSLSKEEYFLGLKWREENVPLKQRQTAERWLEKKFKDKPEVLYRLSKWGEAFEQVKVGYRLMREFYLYEGKKTGKSIREILKYYHAKPEGLFTEEELDKW